MKKLSTKLAGFAAATAMFAMAFTASAAPINTAPGVNKLLCFDGTTETAGFYGGDCTLNSSGAKGSATLDNSSSNPNGDYSGVYVENSSVYGQTLGNITQLSYHYFGNIAPMPGNLSLNIPVNASGTSTTTDAYAYVDAYYCSGVNGNVDIINDADCGIWFMNTEYANWYALVAAYPDATVAMDAYTFVVAQRTPSEPFATWVVNNVKFGKAGK